MGGGASKNNNNVTSVTETKNKNNNTDTNNYNNRVYGPKNGELAPLPFISSSSTPNNMNNFSSGNINNTSNNSMNNIYTRPTWNDSVPLQPIGGNTKKTIPREETPVVPISVIPTPLEPKPKVSSSPSLSSSPSPLSKPISSLSISSSPTHLNTTSPDLVIRGSSPISSPPQPFLSSPSPIPSSVEPRSISPPPAPPSTAAQPIRGVSPPLSIIDPFKNKHNLLERKLSEGINSPITRFKHTLAGSAEKFSTHEEDQVLVDDNDEDEEDITKEKSSADKYYENFAVDKPRMPPTKQNSYYSNNNSGMNTPLSGFKRQLQHASSVTFHLSDSEDGSDNENENNNHSNNNVNQQNTDERATTAELGTSRKNIPVPSLKLNEIGAKKPAAMVAKPVPEVVAPVPKQHGNFDNDKFRAANAKKKVVDSMFKQTTYDYKAQNKSSPTNGSTRSSSSDPMTCSDRSSSVSSSSSSRPDTYDSSSLGYSSDNSQDSPSFIRPPNTPHNKPAYDDYEESLISSILNEPKTPA